MAVGSEGDRPSGSAERGPLVRLLFGSMAAQTLRAAVGLRVVELIGDGERTAAEVAEAAGTQPQATLRLLRALAGLGVLREGGTGPGAFSVAPTGALLDPAHPESVTSLVTMFTEPMMLRAWEHLDVSVRTGGTSFDPLFGKGFFAHLKEHPELSAEFNTAMSQGTRETAALLPGLFDFGRYGTVADIGGGDGTLLAAVLNAHPQLCGVVYDSAEGLAQAPGTLARSGLGERCSLVAGDFFRSVPEGLDLYLLKSIVHDWNDEQVVTILGHCATALAPRGRVLIVEQVLPRTVPVGQVGQVGTAYLTDLNMLVNVGGRERTRADFDAVCARAGLEVVSVAPLPEPNPYSLIETRVATRVANGLHRTFP
ncbi:methyltransferase [Streptomyces sp. NPDC050504]|uniref:methyltransferase n=1 Tax=Streptomyces sp. NPDC050504 TaxID=3365618 RepID=UPI0037BC4476